MKNVFKSEIKSINLNIRIDFYMYNRILLFISTPEGTLLIIIIVQMVSAA